jgi:hypothetical protein
MTKMRMNLFLLSEIADDFYGKRIHGGLVKLMIIFIVFFLLMFYAEQIDQFLETLPSLMP